MRGAAQAASARSASERATASLTSVLDALALLRAETGTEALIAAAPRELCRTGVFDRVMWSNVEGSMWIPRSLYVVDGDARRQIDDSIENTTIALASPLIEAEVVRRRMPALVLDAPHEPRAHGPLVSRAGVQNYVVAPVVAQSSVVGLIHADRTDEVNEADRDVLRLFADGVGVLYELASLAQRAADQRRSVEEVCDAAARVLAGFDAPPDLVANESARFARRPAPQPVRRISKSRESTLLSRLTAREREVLALLAGGITNAQLADRLTVAESTVKSHVKHILHKLGAGNRAAAIAFYLRESRLEEGRSL